jgi:hypothetical protein
MRFKNFSSHLAKTRELLKKQWEKIDAETQRDTLQKRKDALRAQRQRKREDAQSKARKDKRQTLLIL